MKKVTKKILIASGIVVATAGIGVVTTGLVFDNIGITYDLDSDVKVQNINNGIVIDNESKLPGMTIRHSDETKHAKGEFKVQAFTDLHLDHKKLACDYTFSMLARNIMNEKPDFVVFCGDNVTSNFNKPRTKQFAQLMEDLGVYWAAVLGNHEKTPASPNDKGNPLSISRDRMLNIWASYPHCLNKNLKYKTSDGKDVEGDGNCVVNLESKSGVTQSLFFLDSHTIMSVKEAHEYEPELHKFVDMGKKHFDEGKTVFSTDYYDYVRDSQVQWYKETFDKIKEANKGHEPHSTVFSHHPIKEMETCYLNLFNSRGNKDYHQGIAPDNKIRAFTIYNQDADNCKDAIGLHSLETGFLNNRTYKVNGSEVPASRMIRRENLCYSPHDVRYEDGKTPLFEAIASEGANNAFFCGHDHSNNFALKYKNVFMGYIQPGCYSSSNAYKDGMLGDLPYVEEEKYNHGDHIIQGYTSLTYSSTDNVKNVLTDFVQKENYYLYPELREKAFDVIKKYTSKPYENKRKDYLDANTFLN